MYERVSVLFVSWAYSTKVVKNTDKRDLRFIYSVVNRWLLSLSACQIAPSIEGCLNDWSCLLKKKRRWLSISLFGFVHQSHFISALTVVFVNSKSLSSLKIDDTPVDDPSLKVLVANNSDTLKLLKMSSCPHVSPAGTTKWKEWYSRDVNDWLIIVKKLNHLEQWPFVLWNICDVFSS